MLAPICDADPGFTSSCEPTDLARAAPTRRGSLRAPGRMSMPLGARAQRRIGILGPVHSAAGAGRSSIYLLDMDIRVAGFALFGFRLAFRALRSPRRISSKVIVPRVGFLLRMRSGTESGAVHF
jgi:hypothetical protein